MNKRLLFGILIPLVLAIVLVILSISGVGLSVSETTTPTLDKSLFLENSSGNGYTLVQTISVNNNFFLGRKFEIPYYRACLMDTEGVIGPRSASLKYSRGTRHRTPNVPILDEVLMDFDRYTSRIIDLGPHEEKTVQIKINGKYSYYEKYEERQRELTHYDKVFLYADQSNSYRYCDSLDEDTLKDGIFIPLV